MNIKLYEDIEVQGNYIDKFPLSVIKTKLLNFDKDEINTKNAVFIRIKEDSCYLFVMSKCGQNEIVIFPGVRVRLETELDNFIESVKRGKNELSKESIKFHDEVFIHIRMLDFETEFMIFDMYIGLQV